MKNKLIFSFMLFLLMTLSFLFYSHLKIDKLWIPHEEKEGYRLILIQDAEKEEKKEETDSHYVLLMKQLKEKVDGWLKSLNDRIEREDITHLEVRFLEILRNILEWVQEKIDSQIDSSKKEKKSKKKGGMVQETYRRHPLLSGKG
jgi:hypothetical protein